MVAQSVVGRGDHHVVGYREGDGTEQVQRHAGEQSAAVEWRAVYQRRRRGRVTASILGRWARQGKRLGVRRGAGGTEFKARGIRAA